MTANRQISAVTAAGFTTTINDPKDARRKLYTLSAKAHELITALRPEYEGPL